MYIRTYVSLVNQTPLRPPFYHYGHNDKMEGGEGSGSRDYTYVGTEYIFNMVNEIGVLS